MVITKGSQRKNSKGRKNPVKPSVKAIRPWGPNSQMLQTIGTKRAPRGRYHVNGEDSKKRTPILLSDNEEPVSHKRRKQEPPNFKPRTPVTAKAPIVIDLTGEDDKSEKEGPNDRSRQTLSSDLFFSDPLMQPEMVTSVLDKPELDQDETPVGDTQVPLEAEGESSDQQQQQPEKTEQKPQLEKELHVQAKARKWISGFAKEISQHQKNIQKYEGWQQEIRREHLKTPSKQPGWSRNRGLINAEKTLMADKERRLEEVSYESGIKSDICDGRAPSPYRWA